MSETIDGTISRAELEARVRVIKWRTAQACVHEALTELERAADNHFSGCCAVDLVKNLECAQKEAGAVTLAGGPITKADEAIIEEVLAAHAKAGWHQAQAGYDDGAARTAQQEKERAQIRLENQQAAQAHAVRTAGISPAAPAHPPFSAIPRDVVADWDKEEDGPSLSQKPKPPEKK